MVMTVHAVETTRRMRFVLDVPAPLNGQLVIEAGTPSG
jgi:hypothetical protein